MTPKQRTSSLRIFRWLRRTASSSNCARKGNGHVEEGQARRVFGAANIQEVVIGNSLALSDQDKMFLTVWQGIRHKPPIEGGEFAGMCDGQGQEISVRNLPKI